VAHHYTDELDWMTISPTVDWGRRRPRHHRSRSSPLRPGALVGADHRLPRAQRAHALDIRSVVSARLGLRYERYGVGMGSNVVEGVELLGHTGFIGAFAFYAPECDAVLVGTHNASHVDRWPLVAALCRELRKVR